MSLVEVFEHDEGVNYMVAALFFSLVSFQVGWGIKKGLVTCIGLLWFLVVVVVVVVVVGCLGSIWKPRDGPCSGEVLAKFFVKFGESLVSLMGMLCYL